MDNLFERSWFKSVPELQPGEIVIVVNYPDGIVCYVEREDYYYIVNIQ